MPVDFSKSAKAMQQLATNTNMVSRLREQRVQAQDQMKLIRNQVRQIDARIKKFEKEIEGVMEELKPVFDAMGDD